MATLRRLGWEVLSPTLWLDDRGQQVDLTRWSPVYVGKVVELSVDRWLGQRLAEELGDPDLSVGVWTAPLRRAAKECRHWSYVKGVACHTVWTQGRLWTAKRAESPLCP